MIVGTLNKIREEKANLVRDIEYIREMASEDAIDDRLFDLEMRTVTETGNIYAESVETVEKIPVDDSFRQEEVNRILDADHNLSFDEMLGIED